MEPTDQETTRGPVRPHGGPRRPEEKPFLVGIAGEHAGRLFPLEGLREVFVGRSADCEIHCYLDELVSRRHVQIEFDETGRAWLSDLESLNGTLVNGREVARPVLLRRGDRIYVGDSNILKLDYLTDDEVTRWQSAAVDALTECFNRAMLDSRAPELFERARARERSFAVIVVDVDRFKRVNDEHGHHAGDFVLQQVAAALVAWLETHAADASTYRFGGEEFVVLCPNLERNEAISLAEGLRRTVNDSPWTFEGAALSVTVSCGVASLDATEHDTFEELLREADENLFKAKRAGRNAVIG